MGVVQRSVRGRMEDLRSVRTTPRLLLSIPCAADVIALFRFLGDRDAMRYTHVVDDLASCRHLVETHEKASARLSDARPGSSVNARLARSSAGAGSMKTHSIGGGASSSDISLPRGRGAGDWRPNWRRSPCQSLGTNWGWRRSVPLPIRRTRGPIVCCGRRASANSALFPT
jgi:hypothetical protein